MDKVKKVPLPIAGTALGLAALGNLIQNYSEILRTVLGVTAAVILILVVFKLITNWKGSAEELKNPVVASSFVTFFMTFVILSSYVPGSSIGRALWFFGVIGHLLYLIWFSVKFIMDFKLAKVFPSWFVPFVGMVVGSVTAPAFGLIKYGKMLFWLGFVLYLIQLVLVTYRSIKLPELPPPAVPTFAIYAAPASLLLAGYIRSFTPDKTAVPTMIYFLLTLSVIFYAFALYIILKEGFKPFKPSFSSFTFPVVISGIAVKLTSGWLKGQGRMPAFLKYIVNIQELIAVVCVIAVLILYVIFIFKPVEAK